MASKLSSASRLSSETHPLSFPVSISVSQMDNCFLNFSTANLVVNYRIRSLNSAVSMISTLACEPVILFL